MDRNKSKVIKKVPTIILASKKKMLKISAILWKKIIYSSNC